MAPRESDVGPLEPEVRWDDEAPPGEGQIFSDADQESSDADQRGADTEQAAAESDQAAADQDQAASDRALSRGGDLGVHEVTRELRDRSAQLRRETARSRANAAAARNAVANARDQTAGMRDVAADLRDVELSARDEAWLDNERAVSGVEIVMRAAGDRQRGAADRVEAASGRFAAAEDRRRAAGDRRQAARDRAEADADREALLDVLATAEIDALTGAGARGAGLADLELEIDRARRTDQPLVAAYVDVVGLKLVNDTKGHAAGDELLRKVVRAIREHLRLRPRFPPRRRRVSLRPVRRHRPPRPKPLRSHPEHARL